MHGSSAGSPVPLSVFGGLVTLASADSLPEGASPRTYDTDFLVGQVGTRDGLTSIYSFSGETSSTNGGGAASSSSGGVALPHDAVITQIIPTVVAGVANPAPGFMNFSFGPGAGGLNDTEFYLPPPGLPNIGPYTIIAPGTYYGNSVGTSLSAISGQIISETMGVSLFTSTVDPWRMTTTAVGYGVIYTSATPIIDPQMPPPFAIPGGSGLAWAIPFGASGPQISYFGTANATAATGTGPYVNATGDIQMFLGRPLGGTGFSINWSDFQLPAAPAWSNPNNILTNDSAFTSTNASTAGDLDVTHFSFSIPSTISVTGAQVKLYGYADSAVDVSVQLLVGGVPRGTIHTQTMPLINGVMTFGDFNDLWSAITSNADVNGTGFGLKINVASTFPLATAYLNYATIELGITPGNANFNYIGTFVAQNKAVKNIALDADGDLWVEDVTNNPGVLQLALTGITPNSFATGVNGPDVEYLTFNDGFTGSDIPRQYTPNWIDKITQVGPGASPVFAAQGSSSTTYPISTITQPAAQNRTSSYFLQSAGPGSTSIGNVVTVYYSDLTLSTPDSDLVTAFNSGNPVYLYFSFTGTSSTIGPVVVQVTSVGTGSPPGQPRSFAYFTYAVTTSAFTYFQGSGHPGFTANYQRTLATLTTTAAVPGLSVGNTITITGASVPAWDAAWIISQTINSGTLVITNTAVASGVATYSYSVSSGAAPTAGELITISGTLNDGGALNVVNATIVSSTGGSSGTFTLSTSAPDAASTPEGGQATTAGTQFAFDPGAERVTTSTNPIFGNSTGGTLTFAGSGQFVAAGTKQGVVFFITRNGYWTAPGPPVTFTVPENTTSILASNIPIGPPNVIARGIAFTESGQLGTPGANFFTIPTPVTYIVQNVQYTATSLIINDNTSTTASFFFTDDVLLNAEAIDIQGFNLFNQIEIGNPGWVVQYDSRLFFGLCQNKIQNFVNLSFDGGYLPGGQLVPLGWTQPDIYGSLLVSPVFGNSYYINNSSGGSLGVAGKIAQSAFQDVYKQPILNANTSYSVRVTARIPSGLTTGNLVVELDSGGIGVGSLTIPFVQLTDVMTITTGPLLSTQFTTVPGDLTLSVYASTIANGADVEIDRIEIFDTAIPVLTTTVYGSYANDPEQIDGVSGQVQFISENRQPVNGAVVMYDTFYGLKESSMYSLQSSPNLEPSNWNEPEVAQRAGACGINSFDFGEQWIVEACRNGVYLYEGGLPGKITQEIFQVWNYLNWDAKQCIWVRNDVKNRRLFIGVPMPTPNFWLPDAPVNTTPTTPNVILMMNYQGLDSGEEIKGMKPLHVTMFGTEEAGDMRRKWSIWQIPSPYAAFVKTHTDEQFDICNGLVNSKIYFLDPANSKDDGVAFTGLYTTYGFVNPSKIAAYPMLGIFRKRWKYMTMTFANKILGNVRFLLNTLIGPTDSTTGYNTWTVPGGFPPNPIPLNDREASLNVVATRVFVEISGEEWLLSNLTLKGIKDTWNELRGLK